jgi:hypothetical protein
MTLRLLEYLTLAYKVYLKDTAQDVMSSIPVRIPLPIAAVFYNGKERLREDQKTLRLSDLFAEPGLEPLKAMSYQIEAVIRVIDIHDPKDPLTAEILAKAPSLAGYASLTARIERNMGSGMAVAEAIREAIESEIDIGSPISDFLEERRKEMIDMLFMEVTEEQRLEVALKDGIKIGRAEGKAEGKAEGRAEGRAEGKAEGLAEAIKILFDGGMPIELIAGYFSRTANDMESLLGSVACGEDGAIPDA